ncbi:MAG: lactonase family protein [Ferruginibacter sp.]
MRFFFLLSFLSFTSHAQTFNLLIGTYSGSGSKGIYVYRFNSTTGKSSWLSNTDSVINPSYLSLSPGNKFVYAVNETGGNDPGKISAFAFGKNSGSLRFLNQQLSGGDHPCYISIDKANKWVFVSNYNGGNVSAFRVNKDGSLKPHSQLIQNTGSSIIKPTQERPHVHATLFSPKQDFVFVTDLGTDQVFSYKFKPSDTVPLEPMIPPFVNSVAGSGPRHLTFHPNKKFAYVIEELSGTVAVYKYNAGTLFPLQRLSTHPSNYSGKIGSADIHISPDGKFLYTSNRGESNTIAIFSIYKKTGMLTAAGHQSSKGRMPRNFAIDPTGNFLLAANLETNNIVVFKRNKKTGKLTDTGEEIKIPKPVFLLFGR